jgi:hypothetical protein
MISHTNGSFSSAEHPYDASFGALGVATRAIREARDHRRSGGQEKNIGFPPDLLPSCKSSLAIESPGLPLKA